MLDVQKIFCQSRDSPRVRQPARKNARTCKVRAAEVDAYFRDMAKLEVAVLSDELNLMFFGGEHQNPVAFC